MEIRLPSRRQRSQAWKIWFWERSRGYPKSISITLSSLTKMETSSSAFFETHPKEKQLLLFWSSKDRYRTRKTKRKDIGPVLEQTRIRDNRSRHVIGSTGWRPRPGRWWRQERAQLTAASMRWREIPPAAWDCRIISGGSGNRAPAFL